MTGRRLIVAVTLMLALAACTTTTESNGNPATDAITDIPVDLLHDQIAAKLAVDAIEKRARVETAMVRTISVYPTYLIMDVQDPNIPEHLDTYTWRDGDVEPPEPVHLSGPQEDVEAALYPTSAVNLGQLAEIVQKAERLLKNARPLRVEHARASYLYIERSSSLDGRIVIRISIDGPRRSGSVETSATGEVLEQTVN